jgi:uncharacterized protein YjlB
METDNMQIIHLKDDGTFPNSELPVIFYKNVLDVPLLFPASYVKRVFEDNGWTNSWDDGIFEFHHYHSNAHEVLGIYEGETVIQLGGEKGKRLKLDKGDVLVIPAGVAHKNLHEDDDVQVVGAYANGLGYDINKGERGERPQTDENIKNVQLPDSDPVYGKNGNGLLKAWVEK